MRGIGYTLINFINHLPEEAKSNNSFMFHVLPDSEALFKDPLELLSLDGVQYEIRELKPTKRLPYPLPWRLNLPLAVINRCLNWKAFYFATSRIKSIKDIDVFLQADQNQPLPSGLRCKKVLIIYDLIPQILEWDYLNKYKTSRLYGKSRTKASIRSVQRMLITRKLRKNTQKANKLLAISEHTKKDFVNYFKLPESKITVTPLGADAPITVDDSKIKFYEYKKTGWGYAKKPITFDPEIPFLLFVGGVDRRRKLQDLVAAFNNLRAQGYKLKLVLVGDILLGPKAVTTPEIRQALKDSSYLEDIVFMGFASDQVKDWLFRHALAFVFPSRYEGFGLPVLEAMMRECPVISYRNDATSEVAGSAPLYTDSFKGIFDATVELLSYDHKQLTALRKRGLATTKQYDWDKTSAKMFKALSS
jgi:glycosyltransferase involved in cell wall biosynthesis